MTPCLQPRANMQRGQFVTLTVLILVVLSHVDNCSSTIDACVPSGSKFDPELCQETTDVHPFVGSVWQEDTRRLIEQTRYTVIREKPIEVTYCGPNTISTPCGNSCQATCGQLHPKYCSKICQKGGCVCIEGYVRRDENGPCIPKEWCAIAAEEWDWIEEPYPKRAQPRFGNKA